MKNQKYNYKLFLLLFLCFNCITIAQENKSPKEKITDCFSKYFELERENIHVHLDKNIFFTNESIWFKGYIFNRKNGVPYYTTTNVYMQLIDESGTIISRQLHYVINGLFSGNVSLNSKLQSGIYYLQFYTNWMNNFNEDESFVQKIKIINTDDTTFSPIDLPNYSKINLSFFPEGGNLITDVSNIIGIKTTDINGVPISNSAIDIQDEKGEIIKTVTTNSQGLGKFELTPNNKSYKAALTNNGLKFEYLLPISIAEGITLEVNDFAIEGKTIVKIKASKDYLTKINNKTVYLVIQQDEKSNLIELALNDTKINNEIVFSNDYLFKGVNTIRIIDSEMNQLAERYLFEDPNLDCKMKINVGITNKDKIYLSGNSNSTEACLSISVLPINSLLSTESNILSSLYLNPYFNDKVSIKTENFSNSNRYKKFELDLLMLNQGKNKYLWENIRSKPPITNYEFEKGIQIKGVVNSTNVNLKNYKVELRNGLNDIFGTSLINEKNEFYFTDTNVTDSLVVYCDLINKNDFTESEMSYYLTVTNNYKKFNKNYIPVPYIFAENKTQNTYNDFEMPKFDSNTIYLDAVEIKEKKNSLKRQNQSGNSFLRGTKISDNSFDNVLILDFIQANGFTVINYLGEIIINGRAVNSINGVQNSTPLIFMDGRQLMNFDELFGMRMGELDEIYLSSTAIVSSMNNNNGIIKMYRKAPDFFKPKKQKSNIIKGGFEVITSFVNADYLSVYSKGFENFGLISWIPWVLTDNSGILKISIENKNLKKIKLIIEGFSVDGKLISEIKEISLQE